MTFNTCVKGSVICQPLSRVSFLNLSSLAKYSGHTLLACWVHARLNMGGPCLEHTITSTVNIGLDWMPPGSARRSDCTVLMICGKVNPWSCVCSSMVKPFSPTSKHISVLHMKWVCAMYGTEGVTHTWYTYMYRSELVSLTVMYTLYTALFIQNFQFQPAICFLALFTVFFGDLVTAKKLCRSIGIL